MASPRAVSGAIVAGVGWAVLSLAAIAAVLLSVLVALAGSELGRPYVASAVVRLVDDAVAGSLELGGIAVLPAGGIELRELRIYDPEGRLVLAVDRARVHADLTRIRNRSIGLRVELDAPSILLDEDDDGGLSLVRAFEPARARAPRAGADPAPDEDGAGWTVRLRRVEVRGGELWWVGADGETRVEARALDLDGRGIFAPGSSRAEASLRGELSDPFAGPIALELRGALEEGRLRVPVLRARAGETAVAGFGEVDLATGAGRAAITDLEVDPAQLRALVPEARPGALALTGYVESDGRRATAAVTVVPREPGASEGRAEVAAAARLDDRRAVGLDLVLDRFDPSRLHAAAPAGRVTARGQGRAAGESLETLDGHLRLALARSTLRTGALGPGSVELRVDRGSWDVRRLALEAPGLTLEGAGRYRPAGAASGRARANATDLAVARRNLEALLGIALPELSGRARVEATLAGTGRAPVIDAVVEAPRLGIEGIQLLGTRADARITGPAGAIGGRIDATVGRLLSGGSERARALTVRGGLEDDEGFLTASAQVPGLGRDPVTLEARGRLADRRAVLALSELTLAYPGTRYALAQPARIVLDGPRVDALELAAGPQRVRLEGGVGRRGALDARLALEEVRLARRPAGILPAELGLAGAVTADLRARGRTARPVVEGRIRVEDGSYRTLSGLRAVADGRWDAGARRATFALGLTRRDGGAADATVDLPLPLDRRPAAAVSVRLRTAALPIEELVRLVEAEAGGEAARPVDPSDGADPPPIAGRLTLDAELSGTAGAPALRATARLADATVGELGDVALDLVADASGERIVLRALASHLGDRAALAHLAVPLDPSALLARPAETVRAALDGRFALDLEIPGLPLGRLAGRFGIPETLAGDLSGEARLEGSREALRGRFRLALARGAFQGYRDLAVEVNGAAGAERVSAQGRVRVGPSELLAFTAALGAPLERLAGAAPLRAAPLEVDATVPRFDLDRAAGGRVPLAGIVEGRAAVTGTLAAPRIVLDARGERLAISGRPLGDASARVRTGPGGASAVAALAAAPGGTVEATLRLDAPVGLDFGAAELRAAPAELAVRADALQLGFLPAALPGVIRAASGRLDADVVARGPLGRLRPRGTVQLSDGRVAVTEYGEWTGIRVDAQVTDDAVEVTQLAAERGKGRLEARGALRGISSGAAKLEGRLTTSALTIVRAGMDLVTLDLEVNARGGWRPGALDVTLEVPRGEVRLPRRAPRELQSLERRSDIVIGPVEEDREPEPAAAVAGAVAPEPLTVTARLVAPRRLMVVSDNPRMSIELEVDATYERVGGDDYMSGTVEVVRGEVEPIGGRNFVVQRGRVTFTGGPPQAALLDVEAVYTNPAASVTVTVAGPLREPEVRLTSQPPMDEAQIAMLIATGRTEFRARSGGADTLTGEEAGRAALGAIATQFFRDVVADRLPFDTVALDSSSLRAGNYFYGNRIYVGYTRRLDAQLRQGENLNEVRVEYQITPRWTFESRYGDAESGGASLIWSRDY